MSSYLNEQSLCHIYTRNNNMKIINITNCCWCPYSKNAYLSGKAILKCTEKNDNIIINYHKIPNWCPLEDKKEK